MCGSCATKHREPCQAGDRAALSGLFCVPQSTCTPMFRNFFENLFSSQMCTDFQQILVRKRKKVTGNIVPVRTFSCSTRQNLPEGRVQFFVKTGSEPETGFHCFCNKQQTTGGGIGCIRLYIGNGGQDPLTMSFLSPILPPPSRISSGKVERLMHICSPAHEALEKPPVLVFSQKR